MARKLGEQLMSEGVLDPTLLARALERQKATGQKLGECLVRLGLDETPVLRLLAQELKTRFVSTAKLSQARIEPSLLERVPVRLAEGFEFMPLRLDETGQALYVAISEPQRQRAIEEISRTVGVARILPLVALRRAIRAAIRKHYYSDPDAFEHMSDDDVCPHCGAPTAPGDFQCARCELLLVRSPDDLPPRDNVSLVRALLSQPDNTFAREVPRRPHDETTRVYSYLPQAPGPTQVPRIIGGLDLVEKPLNPFEAYILSFVDGRTPLGDIARITSLTEVELRAIFESLGQRGLTQLTEGEAQPRASGPASPSPTPPPEPIPPPVLVKPAPPAPAASRPAAPSEVTTDSVLQRVVQLERAERFEEAIELLEKGISRLRNPAPLYNRLGMILLNQRRDYAKAKALFKKATDLEPDNSVFMMNLYAVMSLQAEATNVGKKPRR